MIDVLNLTTGEGGVTRRRFLAGLASGSLVVAARLSGAETVTRLTTGGTTAAPFEPDLFVAIAPDGAVTILAHRSEMGTGIRTALPMVLADELGADWDKVSIKQAVGDARLGSQNTDGSRSIRDFYQRMRVAGATARTLLEQAAAAHWGVPATECQAGGHQITHPPSGRALAFGALVAAAGQLEVPKPDSLRFRSAAQRRYVGRDVPIADLDDMVTGRAVFGIDARKDNQLYAVVARPPVLGGRVKTLDASAARAVAGVVDVVEVPPFEGSPGFQPLGGVAVLAKNTWAAIQGRKALKIVWSHGAHAAFDSDVFEQELAQTARKPGKVWRNDGDVDAAFQAAAPGSVVEADYYVPLLAHASMEPPCALADVAFEGDAAVRCETWAATQNPQAAQTQLAGTLGLSPEQVIVHVTLLGGGFGRKSKPDYVVEAAWLSKHTRRPVHVTWTREDDLQHDYYHTVAAAHMRAAVDGNGMPQAWLQRSVFPSIGSTFNPKATSGGAGELGMGFTDLPFRIPHLRVENGPAAGHVRIGWLRSVANIYHAFAIGSFADELAHRAGRDPYEYLMALLGEPRKLALTGVEYSNYGEPLDRYPLDVGRLRQVTERAATLAGWGRDLPQGRGLGIACHRSFLSYCANVVEVAVDDFGRVTIPSCTVVIDAGLVVHPDRVRAQMEGAAVFGASLALFGEITARSGRIEQANFDTYPIARLNDGPLKITVEIVQSEALPGGVGEVGVPPFAPALCNAVFAATHKRIRRLPLARHDLART